MQCAHAVDRRKQGLSRGEEGLLRLAHKMGAWDVRLSFRASRAPAEYCLAREASVKQRAARCTDRESHAEAGEGKRTKASHMRSQVGGSDWNRLFSATGGEQHTHQPLGLERAQRGRGWADGREGGAHTLALAGAGSGGAPRIAPGPAERKR